jgi:peptide deformylase
MVLPIVVYGDPVLRKKCVDIDKDYPNLGQFINDMYETMYEANGVGLAAPQVNKAIRLFVVDASPFAEVDEDEEPEFTAEEMKQMNGFKKTFINAQILEEVGEEWKFNEGCLSIPKIREDITRAETVTLSYMDENFKSYTETFNGMTARIILHEYDHIDGKLFIDYLKPLRRKILQGKLNDISKGNTRVDYKMIQIK